MSFLRGVRLISFCSLSLSLAVSPSLHAHSLTSSTCRRTTLPPVPQTFERLFSSARYAFCVLFVSLIGALLQLLFVVVFSPAVTKVASGPFPLLYASLVLFYFCVPTTARLRVGDLLLSNKLFLYVLAAHLALSQGVVSDTDIGLSCFVVRSRERALIRSLTRRSSPRPAVRARRPQRTRARSCVLL